MLSECHSNVVLCTEMKQGAGDGYVARSLWTYYTIPRTGSRVWKQQSDLWDAPIGFHNTSYLFSIWYHSYRPLNALCCHYYMKYKYFCKRCEQFSDIAEVRAKDLVLLRYMWYILLLCIVIFGHSNVSSIFNQ